MRMTRSHCSIRPASKEIAMNLDTLENGWRRFLDRLKELWGKRDGPDPKTA